MSSTDASPLLWNNPPKNKGFRKRQNTMQHRIKYIHIKKLALVADSSQPVSYVAMSNTLKEPCDKI